MHRSILTMIFFSLWLAVLSPTVARSQACFHTGFVDFGLGPTGGDEIYRLSAAGDDIVVDLRWSTAGSPDAALILSTPTGEVVDSWERVRHPGVEEKHTLFGALSRVAEKGFQYRLRLEDSDGVHADLALRVTVDCPAKELCRYGLRVGLDSSVVTVSRALGLALARAHDADSTDFLADVRAEHPELANEIPGLAWQMEQSRSSAQVGCQCEWVSLESEVSTPPVDTGSYHRHPSFNVHHSIQNPAGAGFRAGAQTRDGAIDIASGDTWGKATLGLQLLCTSIEDETEVTYGTEWQPGEIEITERQIAACPLPCTPKIEHQAIVNGCASGLAAGRHGMTAMATATIDTTMWLDRGAQAADILLTDAATVDLKAASGQTLRDQEGIFKWSRSLVSAAAVTAWLETSGSLDLMAYEASGSSAHTYAFGSLSLEYQMHLIADEDTQLCDDIPGAAVHSAYEDSTGTNGGVVIERWENP